MEESGKEEELFLSNSFTSTSDYHVQRRRLCSPGIGEESSQKSSLPEYTEREPLEENGSSYKLANKHRTRIKELMPCLKEKSQDTLLEGSLSNSETKWWWEDARIEEAAFRKKLQEAELAIGSAEMFLPSFKETISRVTQACYVSAADMTKISMQEDLLVNELEALKSMKGLLQQLLRTSKEKEINTKLVEDLIWKLTEVDTEISGLKSEVLQKERHILQLSAQLQQEKTNLLKASDQSDSIQSVQTHLQCQIEKKETENNQLRTKLQSIEKKIAEWKLQIAECKQQILTEKERKEERKNALKRAASVQKQRAERLGAAVETTTLKIREKEIQLSEALSASNIWKSRHEMVVDEKTRLEVQVETLKKQMRGHLTELQRIQNDERKSKREILGKLNSVISENETISLENAKLKVGKLETEAEELKIRYEKVIRESRKVTEVKDLEMDTMKDQTESRLKDLEHVRDLQKAAEEKLRECQESLLSCQKSCVDKSKAIRELQVQADNDNSFLKQHYIEERNYNIKMKYEEVQRKLEEMESENKELENQLADQEENLQKTELQFKQKVANYDALTRQLEVALEDGRKKLAEEEEKMKSKERLLQLKMLDLENELRQKKEEHKRLARKLNTNAKRREVHLKELEHSLQKSENQNQSIHNYVQFLKTSYVTMFG
ncbi:protein BCAP isoform X2 [Tiliqua scincoides]|uniref:protein BCAP isoform X2 n=1 Tax=Tiliqua scincoides TaxID=71010 RepID=UPI00346357D8